MFFLLLIIIIYLILNINKYSIVKSNFVNSMYGKIIFPTEFDWRKVDAKKYLAMTGKKIAPGNYVSPIVNQHISAWCGCCYMISTLQMIQDRTHIVLGLKNTNIPMIPWVVFNIQNMLNLYNKYKSPYTSGWNACKGGQPLSVLYAIESGKCPLMKSDEKFKGYPESKVPDNIMSNTKIEIKDSKRIEDTSVYNIKKIIIQNGPLVLHISGKLLKDIDDHGIVKPNYTLKENHAVTVVGWTFRNETECWIVRNSWGTYYVPESFPEDMNCVSIDKNDCTVEWERWKGDPQSPGFVLLPTDFNKQHSDGWIETTVTLKTS